MMFWTLRLLAKTCTFWKVRKTYFIISCVTKSKFSYFKVKGVLFFSVWLLHDQLLQMRLWYLLPLLVRQYLVNVFFIIAPVNIEMCALWLVIGDYSRSRNFKMAALCFVNVTQEVINMIEEDTILKSTQEANKFGVTLF